MKLNSIHILLIIIFVLVLCRFLGTCREGYNNIADFQRDISNGTIHLVQDSKSVSVPNANNVNDLPSDLQNTSSSDSSGNKITQDQSGNLTGEQHIETPPEDYVKQTGKTDNDSVQKVVSIQPNDSKKNLDWIEKIDRDISKQLKTLKIPNYSGLLKLHPLQVHEVDYHEVNMPNFGELEIRPLQISEPKRSSSNILPSTEKIQSDNSTASSNILPPLPTTSLSRPFVNTNLPYTPIPITANFSAFSK